MVIEKKVSKYKRGDSFGYRVNISKTDNFTKDEKITILRGTEYKMLNDNIANYEKTINSLNQELETTKNKLLSHKKTKNDLKDTKKEIINLNKENGKLMVENTNLLKKLAGYESLEESNRELQQKLNNFENIEAKNQGLKETIAKQNLKLKEYETNNENIGKIEKIYKETLEKITKQQDETIKELNQQFHNQAKENNDEFNRKLEKYIAVNLRQNEALKEILNLGFLDLIRNKHKKLANKNIEKLDNTILKYVLKEE
jgi:chromosome segregation ATPase